VPRGGLNRAKSLERVKGIEPSSEAWEAPALPLSYTRAVNIFLFFSSLESLVATRFAPVFGRFLHLLHQIAPKFRTPVHKLLVL
jgi:hypothetical protein